MSNTLPVLSRACLSTVTVLLSAALSAQAQAAAAAGPVHAVSVGVTYSAQHAQVTGSGSGFWLQGGTVDADVGLVHGFKVAVVLNGETAASTPGANGQSGAGLSILTFLAGPRYVFPDLPHVGKRKPRLFAEALLGSAHGFSSTFPGATLHGSATSFAYALGGGLDYPLTPHLGLRLLQADYTHSALSNGSGDAQNGIRLGAGLHFTF